MSSRPRKVLLLFLNTGGGHRSTAHAVAEKLRDLYGRRVQASPVDVTARYFSWPLSELATFYRGLVRLGGWPWAFTYYLTNGSHRVALLKNAWWLLTREAVLGLLDDYSPDVITCCHPLLKAPCVRALSTTSSEARLVTLVTDLASGHASWFVEGDYRCLVATEAARERALTCGLPDESVQVTGLPVDPAFTEAAGKDPLVARERLRLDAKSPLILLLSGADGVGPLFHLVKAITHSGVEAQLAVITGRNERQREELASHKWPMPVRVEGFVDNVHEWMLAADLLVTKAGPSTISEALVMELPMVISGALPGQEEPNVDYVVRGGAGVWAPTPREVARTVNELLQAEDSTLARMREDARALARPGAATQVAQIVWETAWDIETSRMAAAH